MYFYAGDYQKAADYYRKAIELAPSDHRVWGSLGDALSAQENEDSSAAYREAASLATEALELNSADAIARANLAHYQARLGNSTRAVALIEKAIEEEPEDMYVRYNAAIVFATVGDESRSLDNLDRAVQLGYQTELLSVDPGLRTMMASPRFSAIASRRPPG
jgi:Flp pilus assembly protein TadD